MALLPLDFYILPPIDWEHKNYILLDYLSHVDASYAIMKLSPYLLWTDKLLNEVKRFNSEYKKFDASLKKDIVLFDFVKGIKYSEIKKPEQMQEVLDIVAYSIPLLESRIQLGYTLNNRNPQFLY